MDIKDNTLLYFISTVPQVLGAMLALIGVFYTLRIDSYKKRIETRIESILKNYDFIKSDKDIFQSAYLLSKEYNIKHYIIQSLNEDKAIMSKLKEHINSYLDFYREEEESDIKELYATITSKIIFLRLTVYYVIRLTKKLKSLFIFNGIIIGLFLISFILPPFISCKYFWHVLVVGVLLSIISLISLIRYVVFSIEDKPVLTKQEKKADKQLEKEDDEKINK